MCDILTAKMSDTPPKVKKRYCCFQDEWLTDESFSQWLRKEDDTTAFCKMCRTTFTIKHDGVKAIKHHQQTTGHVRKCQSASQSSLLSKFFIKIGSAEEEKVAFAELMLTYHGVKHHHSYLSQDCGNKLLPRIFTDSKIAPKIQCSRQYSHLTHYRWF